MTNNRRVAGLTLVFLLLTTKTALVQSQASLDFLLLPSSSTVQLESFALLLQSSDSETRISCSIFEATTVAEADNAVNNPLCNSADPPTSTTDWVISNPQFETSAGNETRVYTIDVQRENSTLYTTTSTGDISLPNINYPDPLSQLLVVSCCGPVQSSSARLMVNVAGYLDGVYNYTGLISFPNPAYENIAPCTCDVTLGRCDINCCCDTECTSDFIEIFDCIPGARGGNYVTDDVNFCNTSLSLLGYSWHQFVCIERTNSPYLGVFFSQDSSSLDELRTSESIQLKLQDSGTIYSYEESGFQRGFYNNPYKTNLPASYVQGDVVYMKQVNSSFIAFFSFPQSLSNGACVREATTQYLEDLNTVCDVKVSDSLCGSGSILDANYYLTSDLKLAFQLSGIEVPIQVSYLCLDNTQDYLKTVATSTSGDIFDSTGTSLFPADATGADPVVPACTGSVNITSAGGICQNTVVKVIYEVMWNGPNINRISSTVYLADVPINSTDEVLTQKFELRYSHVDQLSTLKRSGNPGYDIGLPVLAAPNQGFFNNGSQGFLNMWNPVGTGLCADITQLQPAEFGIEQSSGCILRLALDDFFDCEALRLQIEQGQAALFNDINFVSRFGNPDDFATDFVQVIYDETLNSSNYNSSQVIDYPGRCDNIPHTVVYQFVYSKTGQISEYAISEVVALRISYIRSTWSMRCTSGSACDGFSNETESFTVNSMATFTEAEAVRPSHILSPNDRRYYTSCDRSSTCWDELFLPICKALFKVQPTDAMYRELEINLAWSMLIAFIAIGIFLLGQNWQKIGSTCYQFIPL